MTHPSYRLVLLTTSTLALALGLSSIAAAQDSAAVFEEIVVTARKTEERLQDVPLSVTAFTATEMTRRGIDQLEDVARLTPGLVFEDFATTFNAVPSIRGLNQINTQAAVQNVSTFIDGVYLQRNYGIDVGLADMQRIEIVKGPQSALYGQNAFAGAINYVLATPGDKFEALGQLTGGNGGRFDVKVAAGGPLVEDKLGLRASYARTKYDGRWRNNFPNVAGTSAERVGGHKNESYSVVASFTPVEELKIDATYLKTKREAEIRASFGVAANDPQVQLNCGPFLNTTAFNAAGIPQTTANSPRYICGEISENPLTYFKPGAPRVAGVSIAPSPPTTTDSDFYRIAASYDVTDDIAVNYLFGRVEAQATELSVSAINHITPSNTVPFGRTLQGQTQGGINELESHEARIDYAPDGPFQAKVGYYHSEVQDDFLFASRRIPPAIPFTVATSGPLDRTPWTTILRSATQKDRTTAIFGQGSYAFGDFKFTAEARKQWDNKGLIDNIGAAILGGKFSSFTPRVTAEYQLADESKLYASAAKGVKAGGFNGAAVGSGVTFTRLLLSEQAFDDESNWTYEIGSKNTFLDGRWILNANVFYVDWKQLQISSVPSNAPITPGQAPPVIFLNLGAAESYGLEADGAFAATDNLTFNYSLSLIDPTYKKGTKSTRFANAAGTTPGAVGTFCDNIICPADGEVGGKVQPRVAKYQGVLGAAWTAPINDSIDYYLRGDVSYQSKLYVDEMNLGWTSSRTLVNASVGLTTDNMELQIWAKNLMGSTYLANSLFIIQFGSYTPSYGEKRTVGATLTLRY